MAGDEGAWLFWPGAWKGPASARSLFWSARPSMGGPWPSPRRLACWVITRTAAYALRSSARVTHAPYAMTSSLVALGCSAVVPRPDPAAHVPMATCFPRSAFQGATAPCLQ